MPRTSNILFKTAFIFLSAIILSLSTHAQGLLGIKGEEATTVGVFIKDLRSSEIICDYNSSLAMTPASVTKVITSASALSVLGPDFCFETTVTLDGRRRSSEWVGDIVVRSSGDPTVDSKFFKDNAGFCDSIVSALKRMGIRRVDGRIRVIQTLSDAGPLWQWEVEDIAWPYGTGLYGFNYSDNLATLYPVTGKTRPHVPGLKVDLHKNSDFEDIVRGVGSDRITVYARKTPSKKWALQISVPDPSAVFRARLTESLTSAGISVSRRKVKESPATTKVIYTHHSPVASDILQSLMFRSDNMYAEAMLRAIAPEGTRKDALEREFALWSDRGFDTSCTLILDGSGLARANRIAPRFLADVLEWMASSDMAGSFVGFFPKAGFDGSVKSFLRDSSLRGSVALKTGAMGGVQCYAGYKLDDAGMPTHVIVIMVNGFFCPRKELRDAVQQFIIDTFQHSEI